MALNAHERGEEARPLEWYRLHYPDADLAVVSRWIAEGKTHSEIVPEIGAPEPRSLVEETEWEYPPIRVEGRDYKAGDVAAIIGWYWKSGQAEEDIAAGRGG